MLTSLDDYPLHQTAEPIAHPATGDRNFYDRYFFNGFTRSGDLFFAFAMGLYPNRRVLDASFTVLHDGVQHAVHASRLAPRERMETHVGPLAVEVVEPLRVLRVRVAPGDHGLEADLTFRARTAAFEEPRFTLQTQGRTVLDCTRLTQFGTWEGAIGIAGKRHPVAAAGTLGVRDRSWGIRPIGEPEGGAPGLLPQFFWMWAPIHFDDRCLLAYVNEDGAGRRIQGAATFVPVGEGEEEPMAAVGHEIRWQKDTRRAAAAALVLRPYGREPERVELEPLARLQMCGLGYMHPEWGHGMWKGDLAVGAERWRVADLDPLVPQHLHVQQVVRARLGGCEGVGVLEQLVIGPHAPSGLQSILDGAA